MTKPAKCMCTQRRLRSARTQGFFMRTAMPRLIWVFAGRKSKLVGFVVMWLSYRFLTQGAMQGLTFDTLLLFFSGLVIDVIVITILKLMFRRSRPAHNKDDMVGAVTSVDKYSFPSGHATRAAMVSGYFIFHVCDTTRQTIYIVLWSVCVSVSRVALGRHHLIDVMCGYIVGMLEYLLLVYLWVSRETCLRWLESYFSHFHLWKHTVEYYHTLIQLYTRQKKKHTVQFAKL